MIKLIGQRLRDAFLTFPTTTILLQLALPLLALAIILLLIGFKSGFLKFELLQKSWAEISKIVALSFLMPALGEEIVFRVLFLPHPTENPEISTQLLWGFITLTAFIVYHPLEALTWYPGGRDIFIKPSFLILAALLGAMCTIAYLASGSVWLSVIIHWLAVAVWLVLLGGFFKLQTRLENRSLKPEPGARVF